MSKHLSAAVVVVLAGAGLVPAAWAASQDPPAAPAQAQSKNQAKSPASAAETAIRGAHEAFVKAYNAEDSKALASLFAEDAALIDTAGEATRGREAIGAMYARSFEDVAGLKLHSEVEAVKFLTPDVAQIEGLSKLSADSADATHSNHFSALVVKKSDGWRIVELRDTPAPAADVTPAERLAELEWMVGDWVDEAEHERVSASVRWADNRSYLVRTYSVEVAGQKHMSGTMFIGWDPQTGQIKSWVFDSAGGHGEGLWTRASEGQWVVKAHGVLADGRPTSATQVHTLAGKDAVKLHSLDRTVGGTIAPDVPEILMVRRPPAPPSSVAPGGPAPKAAR